MYSRLQVRIEITPAGKAVLPWVVIARPGRQTVDSHFFAMLGYPDAELNGLDAAALEDAHDTVETALRMSSAFEYIPRDPEEMEAFFEKKLVAFEQKLNEHTAKGPSLHAAIGMVSGTKIIFATSGDVLALQLAETSITSLGDTRGDDPLHFGSFHSGTLTPHAYLLFMPKAMGTLLKSDELKGVALARSSERKLEHLEHVWEKRSVQSNTFRGILLEAKPKVIRSAQTTAGSIARLLDTETKTEELLSPPLLRPFVQQFKNLSTRTYGKLNAIVLSYRNRLSELSKKSPTPLYPAILSPRVKQKRDAPIVQDPSVNDADDEVTPAPPVSSALIRAVDTLQKPLHTAGELLRTTSFFEPQTYTKHLSAAAQKLRAYCITRFNLLPRNSKMFLIIILTLLFLFAQGILIAKRRTAVSAVQEAVNTEVAGVQTLIDAGNASLIYGDEAGARIQIEEARLRITQFPQFTRATAKARGLRSLRALSISSAAEVMTALTERLVPLEEKLRHVVVIEMPQPVEEAVRAKLPLSAGPHTKTIFQKRRYELRAQENQIYKQEPTKDGFDAGKPWIQDGTEVRSGVSLAVDGSIYVITGNGVATELRKGKKVDFTLKPIDPPLTAAIKIWTDENSEYLYVLDDAQERLVVFIKKDGLLKAQYTSPAFTELKDISINERAKTAYLLDGQNAVSIPVSHL